MGKSGKVEVTANWGNVFIFFFVERVSGGSQSRTTDTYGIWNKWKKRIFLLFCFRLICILRHILTMEILFLPSILFRVSKCHRRENAFSQVLNSTVFKTHVYYTMNSFIQERSDREIFVSSLPIDHKLYHKAFDPIFDFNRLRVHRSDSTRLTRQDVTAMASVSHCTCDNSGRVTLHVSLTPRCVQVGVGILSVTLSLSLPLPREPQTSLDRSAPDESFSLLQLLNRWPPQLRAPETHNAHGSPIHRSRYSRPIYKKEEKRKTLLTGPELTEWPISCVLFTIACIRKRLDRCRTPSRWIHEVNSIIIIGKSRIFWLSQYKRFDVGYNDKECWDNLEDTDQKTNIRRKFLILYFQIMYEMLVKNFILTFNANYKSLLRSFSWKFSPRNN